MFSRILCFVLSAVFSCLTGFAQTIVPGGNVSGTWNTAGSPYLVQGEITIHADSTLIIESGVEVIFQGHYKFIVNGIIQAVGTEQDSILFTAANPDTGWWGLRFTNAPDGSQLLYCILEYGKATVGTSFLDRRGGGIYSSESRPEIIHCTIRDCFADFAGGGIYVSSGVSAVYPSISNCTIAGNSANNMGGGIYSMVGSFEIVGCNINNNWSPLNGGGLYLSVSPTDSVNILNCTVSNNSAGNAGGGIYATGGSLTILGCDITGNTANFNGGIRVTNAVATITNSTISGNTANNTSGSIFFDNSQGVINNCIISDNQQDGSLTLDFSNAVISGCSMTGTGPSILYYSSAQFSYCTFKDNTGAAAGGIYIINDSQAGIDRCNFINNSASTGSAIKIYSGSTADISNSIFAWNSSSTIQCNGTGTIEYSDFYGNGQNVGGNIPAGFGVLNTVNANEDSCDQYFNIFMDPMFVDTTSGDYHLQAGSPCIDAGDPVSSHDPDGTIADMGKYYFDQGGTGIFEGYVSGTWTAAGSPYRIVGEITIHADSILTIEPGVEVVFQGHFKFIVNGIIHAVGTVQDSILFSAVNQNTGWGGIRFISAPDGSELSYCIFRHGRAIFYNYSDGGAIYTYSSRPWITHCSITDNFADRRGGGIYYDSPVGGFPQISHCNIINNRANQWGGGIFVHHTGGPFDITDCILSGNIANGNGGGLYIRSVDTNNYHISNCTIDGNSSGENGGGINIGDGHLFIDGCTIVNNQTVLAGGGMYIEGTLSLVNSTLQGNVSWSGSGEYETGGGGLIAFKDILVDSCVISDNVSHGGTWPAHGGGINIAVSTSMTYPATITNSTIMNNTADIGGGISNLRRGSTLTMAYCKILNNTAGGIHSEAHDTNIDHCTVSGNISGSGGFYIYRSSDISNIIFSWNSPAAVYYTNLPSNRTLAFSDFFENNQDITGTIPSGFGVLDTINTNGDSCDVYSNIFMDPMFADTSIGGYHLTVGSPCIDAGDPFFPYDPDNTITDMGRYFFNQGPIIAISDSLLDFGEVFIGQQNDLALIICNVGFDTLILNSIINQQPEFTHNWNPADSLILPGDSLTITVTFAPADTNLIIDTLLIENNDHPLQVQLSGKGKIVVEIEDQSELPKVYALYPAYPNPFNPVTTIRFDLSKSGEVHLIVYDILGRKVSTLVNKKMSAGRYAVQWNASEFASGVYYYRIQAGAFSKTRKLILMK